MTTDRTTAPGRAALKAAHREMWALGDYAAVGRLLGEFGPVLVRACGIGPGHRVLDVGAGTGNVAVPAAAAGASVVASDLTPELLDAGRRESAARGVQLEWVPADAERLPFADGEFDVVTSAIGAIFAPDHQAVADELVRVCRPGGTIGMINWPPEGFAADFFAVFAPYAPPPPPGVPSPLLWGTEQHLRDLFGDRVETLEVTEHVLVVGHFADPAALCDFYRATFGPTIAAYAALAGDEDRTAALDHDFLNFATRLDRGRPGDTRYHYEYVLAVARTRTRTGPIRDRPTDGTS